MFNNLGLTAVDESTVEDENEYVEGASKRMSQGAHTCVINMAYQVESPKGAIGVNFNVTNEDGKTKGFTLYATCAREDKDGNPKPVSMTYSFQDKQSGEMKTQFMKGYLQIRSIVHAVLGVDDAVPSEREIDVYDWDLKRDVKMRKQVYLDLVGKPVILMFREKLEDDWQDTSKSVTKIELEHAANATTRLTRAEANKGITEPAIIDAFLAGVEKDPILDKRKHSKGHTPQATTGGGTASASF